MRIGEIVSIMDICCRRAMTILDTPKKVILVCHRCGKQIEKEKNGKAK